MKFFLLINVKMPTIVGILTFMSRKNSILSLSEPEKCCISWYFHTYKHFKFHAQLSWVWKKFYNIGAWTHSKCNLSASGYLTHVAQKFWTQHAFSFILDTLKYNLSASGYFSFVLKISWQHELGIRAREKFDSRKRFPAFGAHSRCFLSVSGYFNFVQKVYCPPPPILPLFFGGRGGGAREEVPTLFLRLWKTRFSLNAQYYSFPLMFVPDIRHFMWLHVLNDIVFFVVYSRTT